MAHDVFISYATEDKLTADAVCARLEQHGIRCWIAPRDIIPGRDWRGSIVEAIGSARVMVLMLSAQANSSREIPKEVLQATQKSLPIITFRIEDVTPTGPLSYELNTIHWMDAITRPVERHIDQLAETLRRLLDVTSGLESRSGAAAPVPVSRREKPRRRSALAIAGALAAIVALIVAVVLFVTRRPPDSSHTSAEAAPITVPVGATPSPAPPRPAPERPVETKPTERPHEPVIPHRSQNRPSPPPADPVPATAPPIAVQTVAKAVADTSTTGPARPSILGCWRLGAMPGVIHVRPDGTFVSGGVLTGKWSTLDNNAVILEFPDDLGTGELSADGQSLTHSGNINDRWTRGAAGSGVVGSWRLSNGTPMTVSADGTFAVGSLSGRWKLADAARRTYTFIWPGQHPTVTVSPDGNSASYVEARFGVNLVLQRAGC